MTHSEEAFRAIWRMPGSAGQASIGERGTELTTPDEDIRKAVTFWQTARVARAGSNASRQAWANAATAVRFFWSFEVRRLRGVERATRAASVPANG